MQPSEDRHDEGRERLGIPQRRRVSLRQRDDRPAYPRSWTGVFATDGSNPDTTTKVACDAVRFFPKKVSQFRRS